ncbi:MAG: DUF4197 domain-containing protein [Bacteroidota bacterium]
MKKLLIILSLPLCLSFSGCDILLPLLEGVAESGTSSIPTNIEIVKGLKEALVKGATYAVTNLNKEGGYFNDPLVKIPFPEDALFVANTLRDLGLGQLVDNFEQRLNEGAEKGAALALPIFKNAITSMTVADGKEILFGSQNAATSYFQAKTSSQLQNAFSPVIKEKLDEVNATKLWSDITTRYNKIPFVNKKVETDLVKYATDRALAGLFLKLAEEEKLIRENPIERTSDILRKVFNYADQQQSGQ